MRYLFISIVVFSLLFSIFYFLTINQFKKQLVSIDKSVIFYDNNEKPFFINNANLTRNYAVIEDINVNIVKAILAIEDKRFFQHWGFDIPRLIKAGFSWFKFGTPTFGASTITQQLCKITLYSPQRTLIRKIKELFCSISIELTYPKKKILEFYLNSVYFGNGNTGIVNASQNFFNKAAIDLNLAESALLAGLVKRPEDFSPIKNINITRQRQILSLKSMYQLGWIAKSQFELAVKQKIDFFESKKNLNIAPYFISTLTNILIQKLGSEFLNSGGVRVYTTLDLNKQKELENTFSLYNFGANNRAEYAALTMDNSGAVQALVGGRSFNVSQFNRATQAKRQPGSAIKPFIYALAFSEGWLPYNTLIDEPSSYPNYNEITQTQLNSYYEPANYDNQFLGQLTLAYGLEISNNLLAVKLLEQVSINKFVEFMSKINIGIKAKNGLCIALGCNEVSLQEIVQAFNLFNNQGVFCTASYFYKITDANGNIILEPEPNCNLEPVIDENNLYIMRQLLQNVVKRGTGKNANIAGYVGGKTGTTSNDRDAWFIGFASNIVTGIWLGNDDNSPLNNESGGRSPAILWHNYMTKLALKFEDYLPQGYWDLNWFNKYTGCSSSESDIDAIGMNLNEKNLPIVCN